MRYGNAPPQSHVGVIGRVHEDGVILEVKTRARHRFCGAGKGF